MIATTISKRTSTMFWTLVNLFPIVIGGAVALSFLSLVYKAMRY